jgi:hypothetical protein
MPVIVGMGHIVKAMKQPGVHRLVATATTAVVDPADHFVLASGSQRKWFVYSGATPTRMLWNLHGSFAKAISTGPSFGYRF